MKTLLTKKNLLTLMLLLSVGLMFAQSTPPTPATPPPGFPVDGGLLVLGAIALGYGINKKKQ